MEKMQQARVDLKMGVESTPLGGKLKIFFGYAAGVGKTYAMLEAAHQAQKKAWMLWWAMWSRMPDRIHWRSWTGWKVCLAKRWTIAELS